MERDENRNGVIQQQNGNVHPPTHPQSHPFVATPGDVALLRYGLVAGLVREGRVVLT